MASHLVRCGLKGTRLFQLAHRNTQAISIRSCGWVRDWKPGPYPKTPEEREAAAKKYNLIPEDYEPSDEGSGFGDYPKLPIVSQDCRDPYEDFDFYYRRRNWGETFHIDYDMHVSEKSDPIKFQETRYPMWLMIAFFCGAYALFFVPLALDIYFDLHSANPLKPKQYPGDGRKHYTFEPAD